MGNANNYSAQIVFSTRGEENLTFLKELYNALGCMNDRRLSDVYAKFEFVPTTLPGEKDIVTRVDPIRVTHTKEHFAFFVVTTETKTSPHFALWMAICKSYDPHLRVDVLGGNSKDERYCHSLWVPDQLLQNYECEPASYTRLD